MNFSNDMNRPGGENPAAQGTFIKDTNTDSFEADVMHASMQVPVIVDFWAPWCGPCRQLMPALEQAVQQAGGKVHLVKINIDENPELAQALQVQSVPTVYAFFQGKPVDRFMGNVPPSELQKFVSKLVDIANGEDPMVAQITQILEHSAVALNDQNIEAAIGGFMQVVEVDPENIPAKAGLARCYIALDEIEAAQEIINSLPDDTNDPHYLAASNALALIQQSKELGDASTLWDAVQADPDNHQARYDLAQILFAEKREDEAVDALLDSIRRDREWNDGAARQLLLQIFDSLGASHPVAAQGRRKLSSVLFS